jgi:hypothetical protein
MDFGISKTNGFSVPRINNLLIFIRYHQREEYLVRDSFAEGPTALVQAGDKTSATWRHMELWALIKRGRV